MLILVVFLMQEFCAEGDERGREARIRRISFLIDVATSELPGVRELADKQPGVRGKMEALPVVSGRIESIDGVQVEKLKVNNYPKRLLQSVSLHSGRTSCPKERRWSRGIGGRQGDSPRRRQW